MAVDPKTIVSLGKLGAVVALILSAIGSCLGAGAAGAAAIGGWKKCYAQNKSAPFMLVAFVGAPLSQTIYGMILMGNIMKAAVAGAAFPVLLGVGFMGGFAMGLTAWIQGRAGAWASDALAETGQGFGNYLMAIGVIETVALFILVFIGKTLF
jgi:V/A-type H+-transporting ATPase subunit K